MPSRSWREHVFWEAVAHSPAFARAARVPQSAGRDFAKADDAKGITGNRKSLPAKAKPKKAKRHK